MNATQLQEADSDNEVENWEADITYTRVWQERWNPQQFLWVVGGGGAVIIYPHRIRTTYVALEFRSLLVMKLFWCVRNHKVVTLTLLKFLLVAVLQGNSQSSKTAQYSKQEKECVSGGYSQHNSTKKKEYHILWQK